MKAVDTSVEGLLALLRDHPIVREIEPEPPAAEPSAPEPSRARPTAYERAGRVHRRETKAVALTDGGSTAYERLARPSTAYELHGDGLAAWDGREDFARWVCDRAGLAFEADVRQSWAAALGELEVSVWAGDERGLVVLRVHGGWPTPPAPSALSLTEVFIISICGKLRGRSERGNPSPEQARWKRRALMDAGLVPRPAVRLAPLPEDAPTTATTAWAVIGELLQCHRLTEPPGEPVPLSVPFLLDWFAGREGVTESALVSGKRYLSGRRLIEDVGSCRGSFGKATKLWLIAEEPGP